MSSVLLAFSIALALILSNVRTVCAFEEPDAELDKLVKTINDNPDLLHANVTPSVTRLTERGVPAAKRVLKLMASESPETRLRAQTVLLGVTQNRYGFVEGKGWTQEDGEAHWRDLWKQLGDIDYNDSAQERKRKIILWNNWLKTAGTS